MANLLNFDPRIHSLVTIIKYWMKVHDFVGPDKMSNYAVIWLILFYLQTLPCPILPPIFLFQQNIRPYLVNGYNYAFNQYFPRFTLNGQRISQLLLGFFEFYKDYDFKSHIICPLYGRAFQKHNLFDNHPIEFQRYQYLRRVNPNDGRLDLNKFMCIQDPFKLTHILSCRMNSKQFQNFQNKLSGTCKTIKKNLSESGETSKIFIDIMDKDKLCELWVMQYDVVIYERLCCYLDIKMRPNSEHSTLNALKYYFWKKSFRCCVTQCVREAMTCNKKINK